MKISVEKSLALPVAATDGWGLFSNIEEIAAGMPGAKITGRVDDTHYKGNLTVKLGPATVTFKGDIEVAAIDPVARTIHILGRGADTTGSSGASLDLQANVQETGPKSCALSGRSDVNVTGKVAAFGSRLLNTATDQLLNIFFGNLQAKAEALNATAAPSAAPHAIPEAPPAPADAKFNAFAFIWAVLKDFIRGLFGRTRPG